MRYDFALMVLSQEVLLDEYLLLEKDYKLKP